MVCRGFGDPVEGGLSAGDFVALRGDAACPVVCLYLAAAALVGLVLGLFGWWWADPLAGLALIWWIRGEAKEAIEAAAPSVSV
jgi:divalent metal cation (Fe/Co/Zn/Cd) transporter